MSQLPPREPPDLRNPNQQGGGQYPPQQPPPGQYPPQQYPPQQLPQTGPLGQQYPPPGQYPPQQYPPQQLPQTGNLPPYQAPPLGYNPQPPTMNPYQPLEPAAPPPLKDKGVMQDFAGLFHERRIEYLAWGLVVLAIGLGIILLAINNEAAQEILLIPGPLFVGGVLLFSGFLQRIVFGYGVSLFTWGVAVASLSFGLTQLIAFITDTQGSENLTNQVLYFFGILVVLSGMVIILQVFRPPHE